MEVWQKAEHPCLEAEFDAIRCWVTDLPRPFPGFRFGPPLPAKAFGGAVPASAAAPC